MQTSFNLFISGAWRAGAAGETRPVVNPATEAAFAEVAVATPADIDAALASAAASLAGWAGTPARRRGEIILEAARILGTRLDDAAAALSAEQGKTLAEARGEYARAIEMLEWNGQQAEPLSRSISMSGDRALTPQPVGVVAAFTPWNYPAVLIARKLGPALAAGCPVILKAAEETPSAGVRIVEAFQEAGLPAGVISLVFGDPAAISTRLLASPIVRFVSFTGSTAVGRELAAKAAVNLQQSILELGGHSPVVVFADADLDAAAATITEYKFECAGQSCNAPSRILVEASVYPRMVERLVALAGAIRVGPGDDPATTMGPMANARRIGAMETLIQDAVARGAKVEIGGGRLARQGFFWEPTILTGVPDDATIQREEAFGPVLTITPFSSYEEAIARANSTAYGLAAYVFTGSDETAARAVGALSAGAISVNRMKGVSADAPNAGIGESGYGYEGGVEGFRAFQTLKLVNGAGVLDRAGS